MAKLALQNPTLRWVYWFLNRFDVRLVLSACIIISLLPYPWVHTFDGLFLLLFASEFVARASVTFAGRWREQRSSTGEPQPSDERRLPPLSTILLLFLDLVALISFLPESWISDGGDARWLRVFRLTRMLVLLGYWAPLARDVWVVLSRRERARQVVLMGFIVLALSFSGAVVVQNLARDQAVVDFDDDGNVTGNDRQFLVRLWWAFRQVQDPGNMMATPNHAAAVVVSIGLTVFGLFLVSFLIGLGTDVVHELMELSRIRGPGLRNHTVVVNMNASTRVLLSELVRYYRKLLPDGRLSLQWLSQLVRNTRRGLRGPNYVVVGDTHDPPDFLRQPDLSHIVYREGSADYELLVQRTDIRSARRVVLLADLQAENPDAETLRSLLTVVEALREGDPLDAAATEVDGHTSGFFKGQRSRLLIAEILDESNVPAARAAIASGGNRTQAFIVPTERLIALFMACVARRGGADVVLEELLSSRGHEVYTCFFSKPGLKYSRENPPPLPTSREQIMAYLHSRGLRLPPNRRVLPVGLLMQPTTFKLGAPAEQVAINPQAAPNDYARCTGFVAIAPNFAAVRDFSETLHSKPELDTPTGPQNSQVAAGLKLRRSATTPLNRILICGFRSATVSMIESLLRASPHAEILVMVRDEAARAAAMDDFDAHTKLIRNRLLSDLHGQFFVQPDGSLRYVDGDDDDDLPPPPGPGQIRVTIGNWTSSRQLSNLPKAFGHIAVVDVVFLISGERPGADADTVQALMKIETLAARAEGNASHQRVIAEVLDAELAHRLRRHYLRRKLSHVRVYSIETLRALFMFQSVVVPSFDLVYTELLGPWGQSFVRLEPQTKTFGTCTFSQLAQELYARGQLLVGVETQDNSTLFIGEADPGANEKIELEHLKSIWVICDDIACGPQNLANQSPATGT